MGDGGGPPVGGHLISLRAAADTLGVSVRTVRRYIDYGYLEGYRVGPRLVRVEASAVRRLAAHMPDGTDEDPTAAPHAPHRAATRRRGQKVARW